MTKTTLFWLIKRNSLSVTKSSDIAPFLGCSLVLKERRGTPFHNRAQACLIALVDKTCHGPRGIKRRRSSDRHNTEGDACMHASSRASCTLTRAPCHATGMPTTTREKNKNAHPATTAIIIHPHTSLSRESVQVVAAENVNAPAKKPAKRRPRRSLRCLSLCIRRLIVGCFWQMKKR